ncbi:hypothetical protein ATO67_19715 [Agrobacterium bohemicum]|uniref:Uncharacterized protein n=1 Tax=Agrobacterium bohemicum TaxID=2052828 RepID=A0A135P7Q3_9HYPH|nr:hypothetical protein ATO67_19715 [Agrobacterium bohemicum]
MSHDVRFAMTQNDPLQLNRLGRRFLIAGAWIGFIAFALIDSCISRKQHHIDFSQMMIKALSSSCTFPKNASVLAIDQVDQPI